jgi:hypothetical protein
LASADVGSQSVADLGEWTWELIGHDVVGVVKLLLSSRFVYAVPICRLANGFAAKCHVYEALLTSLSVKFQKWLKAVGSRRKLLEFSCHVLVTWEIGEVEGMHVKRGNTFS